MENDDDKICPRCGGKLGSKSAIFVVGVPESVDRFEWVCENCGFKKADIDVRERTKFDESLKTDKNPT